MTIEMAQNIRLSKQQSTINKLYEENGLLADCNDNQRKTIERLRDVNASLLSTHGCQQSTIQHLRSTNDDFRVLVGLQADRLAAMNRLAGENAAQKRAISALAEIVKTVCAKNVAGSTAINQAESDTVAKQAIKALDAALDAIRPCLAKHDTSESGEKQVGASGTR